MLDTPSNTISDVRVQTFDISYEYPVVFTRDAFGSGNRSLIEVLARKEADKLHRCVIPRQASPDRRRACCRSRRRALQERSRYHSAPAREIFGTGDRPALLC